MLEKFINFNGNLIPADKEIITADNRGFRYGDGIFETIKVRHGSINLADYHFERLLQGMSILLFDPSPDLSAATLTQNILDLCSRNGHLEAARVRLAVFRGDGGLYDGDNYPNYVIQSWALPVKRGEAEKCRIGVFPHGRKACDRYSNLKSGNYQVYVQAAIYAQQQKLDDCLILNSYDRIAESTISNLFYCSEGRIYTPPLSEGCVAGVMRRFLMEKIRETGIELIERETTVYDLQQAQEVFLTNALRGIRSVRALRDTFHDRDILFNEHRLSSVCEQIIGTILP